MVKITEKKYVCIICGKKWSLPTQADACRDTHDVVYVPFIRSDLNRLLLFITTKEEDLLTTSLIRTLRKYMRAKTDENMSSLSETNREE